MAATSGKMVDINESIWNSHPSTSDPSGAEDLQAKGKLLYLTVATVGRLHINQNIEAYSWAYRRSFTEDTAEEPGR